VDKIKAFYRDPEGKITEHLLEQLDINHALQNHPHEWSLDGKFLPADDPVATQRRLLASPTFEGQLARDAERPPR
jgi:hypothetical protein